MLKIVLFLTICACYVSAAYWKGQSFDHPDFACYQFPILCENFLEEIGCTDMDIQGCPNYPGTTGDLPNFVGICTCNAPFVYDYSGYRVSQELVINRISPDVAWMLEPWNSGPPYDMARSFTDICLVTLDRLGCPKADQVVTTDPSANTPDNAGGYSCTCGSFTYASRMVSSLMQDYMNNYNLVTTPVFADPVRLSISVSIAILLICGKLGAILAVFFKLPPIVGYLLAGYAIQNYLSLGFLKGTGFPNPSAASELKLIALIIVLMRAGLSIKFGEIKANLVPTMLLCVIPYFGEFTSILLYSKSMLSGWNTVEIGVFASVMAPLGPSVIISAMLMLQANQKHDYGFLPQQITMSAPIEAVVAIVTFGIFGGLAQTEPPPLYPWVKMLPFWLNIVLIPVNLAFSTILGILIGWVVSRWIHYRVGVKSDYVWSKINKNPQMGSSTADLIFVFLVLCYTGYSLANPQYIQQCSGVLVVFACAITVSIDAPGHITTDLAYGLKGIWVFAEVFLFTLTGTSITFDDSNGPLYGQRGLSSAQMSDVVSLIFLGLTFRFISLGVCMWAMFKFLPPHRQNWKEYVLPMWITLFFFTLPKATVQATLGGIPLATHLLEGPQGVNKGLFIAQATAFTVLITAPLGTILIKLFGCKISMKLCEFDKKLGWNQSKLTYDEGSMYYGTYQGEVPPEDEDDHTHHSHGSLKSVKDEHGVEMVDAKDVESGVSRPRTHSRVSQCDEEELAEEFTVEDLVPRVRAMSHEFVRRMSMTLGVEHHYTETHMETVTEDEESEENEAAVNEVSDPTSTTVIGKQKSVISI